MGIIQPGIFNSENAQKQILLSILMADAKRQAHNAVLYGEKIKKLRKDTEEQYASCLAQAKSDKNPATSMLTDIENDNFKNEAMLVYSSGNMIISLENDLNQEKLDKIRPIIKCNKLLISTFKQNISSMNTTKARLSNVDPESRHSAEILMNIRSHYYKETISILNKVNDEFGNFSIILDRLNSINK